MYIYAISNSLTPLGLFIYVIYKLIYIVKEENMHLVLDFTKSYVPTYL